MITLLLAAAMALTNGSDVYTYTGTNFILANGTTFFHPGTNCFVYDPDTSLKFNFKGENYISVKHVPVKEYSNSDQWYYDLKTFELLKPCTNLVIHTELKPIVTHSNGLWWIRLKAEK